MRYRYEIRGKTYEINLERHGAAYQASVSSSESVEDSGLTSEPYEVEILSAQPGELNLKLDGRVIRLYWAADGSRRWLSGGGCTYALDKPTPRTRRGSENAAETVVHAPMPAQVRAVETSEGDLVEKGQTLLLLEAMKMEIRITAPQAGRVSRLHVRPGQTVDRDAVLVELKNA